MTPRRSKARLRVAISGAILLFLNLAAFAAFTWPRLGRVRRAESRATAVADRRAFLEQLWAKFQARKELLERNRTDIESLVRDHLTSRARDLFPAQREVERLARESGLVPKTSTYDVEPVPGTNLVRCLISLPLDGSYTELVAFLSRIESARRFIVVDQLALVEDEQGARMSLTLSVIFKGES